MVAFSAWLNDDTAITSADRAALAWNRIQQKPTVITLRTAAGVTLAAQTVRLEADNRASIATSAAGSAPVMKLIVYGIRNHASQSNTLMEEGYRFVLGSDEYRCVDIIDTIGERQGVFVATG